MKKVCFLMIACFFILIIASVPGALCYPPAGYDCMSTTATIEIEIIGMFTETIHTTLGPTTVSRSNPYDPGDGRMKIDTEIVSMSLCGASSYIGSLWIVESPSKASKGAVQQLSAGVDFPADSFFDVFVEIQTTLAPPLSTLHNDDPVPMSTTIDSIPPWGSTYTPPYPVLIPLKDMNGNIIGFIKHVSHKIQVSGVGGIWVPVDKLSLLAPYFGLTSTIIVATVATAIFAKRRKDKQ